MTCGSWFPYQKAAWASGWEHWIQDPRPSENSWPQGVLISENSHEGLHLYPRPGATQLLRSTQHRTAHPKTKQDRDINPEFPQTPQTQLLTPPCPSEGIKAHLPPECRHKTLPTWSLRKWLDRPHPLQAETKSKKNEWQVTGRKAKGLQMEEIGCKCQTIFISLLSSRRKQTTSVRFFSPFSIQI